MKTQENNSIKRLIFSLAERRERRRIAIKQEYYRIVDDIVKNGEFNKLKEITHHHSSIFHHSMKVSFLSYRIARILGLDDHSAARGGLLHDFFLYDWRDKNHPNRPKRKIHGQHHPKVALMNSRKHFKLNKREKDIIIRHMWPATFIPPYYKESMIVSLADKYCASKEYCERIGRKILRLSRRNRTA